MLKVTKYLLLSLALTLSGCKLVTQVQEGGELDSTSGAYDCAEFSSCTVEITVADFDETFTAVANGGYVFSHWRGGDKYQCPGSENPVCQVTNTQFAGNAGAESVIASDAEYYLEPVFRALLLPSPVVVDANGQFVGRPSGYRDNVWSFYVKVEGSEAAVRVHEGGNQLRTINFKRVYFTGTDCTGEAYIVSSFDGHGGVLHNADGTDTIYAPNLSSEIVQYESLSIISESDKSGDCGIAPPSPVVYTVYPAVSEVFNLSFPLRWVWR